MRLITGATASEEDDTAALASRIGLPTIQAAQAGLLADMDAVADALYDRSKPER